MIQVDVVILGAGAAGMMCAVEAGRRGRRVLVIDHAAAPGEKIRISGGGRCNFTNLSAPPERFLSHNPHFAVSALKRFGPQDFIARVDAAGIAWHEKTLGQLFCDGSARQIVTMLTGQMAEAGAELWLGTSIESVERGDAFVLRTSRGLVGAGSLVLATGGKSIPKMGATGLAYRLASELGLAVTETRPGLVPLTFAEQELEPLKLLAGIAVPARVRCGKSTFEEGFLFTHRGLSGPSILQISSYWREGQAISINLSPTASISAALKTLRGEAGRVTLLRALSDVLPEKLAHHVAQRAGLDPATRLADLSNACIDGIGGAVHDWTVKPVGTEGYRTAEVTLGGIDTRELSSRTMEARTCPGLFVIGEAVDVTGWLGGYNFQWAWSSGWAAGQAV